MLTAALLALTACKDEDERAALPPPVAMTGDALGYYCQMAMTEHPGPKAQIHLRDAPAPLFFSQVRDAIAYQRMPEQSAQIVVIYVSDMSRAPSWDDPGAENWIPADEAFYVVGSDAVGGMGAAEVVPFSRREDAQAFAAQRGGRVVRLSGIADSDVLTPEGQGMPGMDGEDYLDRLKAVEKEGNG